MKPKSHPDAFDKAHNFPIMRVDDNEVAGQINQRLILAGRIPLQFYKMGKLRIMYSSASADEPEFLSVAHPDRYPTWDEMVWVRYKLCSPDADMAMILPKLAEYENYESGYEKNTFTMEAVVRKTYQGKG